MTAARRLRGKMSQQALALAAPTGMGGAVGPPEGAVMETLEDRRKQLVELEARFALQARARTNEVLPGFNAVRALHPPVSVHMSVQN